METQGYQGHKNYETWSADLVIRNDERLSSWVNKTARSVWDDAKAHGVFTRQEQAQIELAERLKEFFEEEMPQLGATLWGQLLLAAFEEIDWYEIACGYIQDIAADEKKTAADEKDQLKRNMSNGRKVKWDTISRRALQSQALSKR